MTQAAESHDTDMDTLVQFHDVADCPGAILVVVIHRSGDDVWHEASSIAPDATKASIRKAMTLATAAAKAMSARHAASVMH